MGHGVTVSECCRRRPWCHLHLLSSLCCPPPAACPPTSSPAPSLHLPRLLRLSRCASWSSRSSSLPSASSGGTPCWTCRPWRTLRPSWRGSGGPSRPCCWTRCGAARTACLYITCAGYAALPCLRPVHRPAAVTLPPAWPRSPSVRGWAIGWLTRCSTRQPSTRSSPHTPSPRSRCAEERKWRQPCVLLLHAPACRGYATRTPSLAMCSCQTRSLKRVVRCAHRWRRCITPSAMCASWRARWRQMPTSFPPPGCSTTGEGPAACAAA